MRPEAAAAVLALFLAACLAPRDSDQEVPQDRGNGSARAASMVLTGRVVHDDLPGGAATRLYLDDGRAIRIIGPVEAEIQRLSRARVTVTGTAEDPASIRVRHYAVLEINGEKPFVGRLIREDGALLLRLEAGRIGLQRGKADSLDALLGSVIWVTGQRMGQGLALTGFGVIRPR